MKIFFSILLIIVMFVIADKKGFNPWVWILAGGIPGFIILLCMPSAAAPDIDEVIRRKRRYAANITSCLIGIIAIILLFGFSVWLTNSMLLLSGK